MTNSNKNYASLSLAEKRELAKQLLARQSGKAVRNTAVTADPAGSYVIPPEHYVIPPEHYDFARFPEYRQLVQQQQAIEHSGLVKDNPFFTPHSGVSNSAIRIADKTYINYSGYNYLGLSGHPQVSGAARDAIDEYGTSVCASRVVSGEIPLHAQLESRLAALLGAEACVVMVSGWGTNVSTIGHLLRPGDLILHDALVHNSALMGCMLSGARRIPFPHNDMGALDRLLGENRRLHERVLIVVEGVYSMDGDIAPLPELAAIKQKHKALLMVDEAHSIGVLGANGGGIREHFQLPATVADIWMGTLSKAFASCGGYIAGCRALIDNLRYLSSGFIYSVGLPASNTAAALAALDVLSREPQRVQHLHERSAQFLTLAKARGLHTGPSGGSPVVPIIIGNSVICIKLSQQLQSLGIEAKPVLYPAVAESEARLRFFVTALHTAEEITHTVENVARVVHDLARSGH